MDGPPHGGRVRVDRGVAENRIPAKFRVAGAFRNRTFRGNVDVTALDGAFEGLEGGRGLFVLLTLQAKRAEIRRFVLPVHGEHGLEVFGP